MRSATPWSGSAFTGPRHHDAGASRAAEPGLMRQDWRNLDAVASRGRVLPWKGAPCCDWRTRGHGISGSPMTAVATTCSFSRQPARSVTLSCGISTSPSATPPRQDLIHWDEAADVLAPAASPAFDDVATWTGSVVRGPDGTWFMFYTGGTRRRTRPQAAHRRGHVRRPLHLARHPRLARARERSPLVRPARPGRATRRGATPGCSAIPAGTAGTCW